MVNPRRPRGPAPWNDHEAESQYRAQNAGRGRGRGNGRGAGPITAPALAQIMRNIGGDPGAGPSRPPVLNNALRPQPPLPNQRFIFNAPGPLEYTHFCSVCNDGFFNMRALCGHMRMHKERNWRGLNPPPGHNVPPPPPRYNPPPQYCRPPAIANPIMRPFGNHPALVAGGGSGSGSGVGGGWPAFQGGAFGNPNPLAAAWGSYNIGHNNEAGSSRGVRANRSATVRIGHNNAAGGSSGGRASALRIGNSNVAGGRGGERAEGSAGRGRGRIREVVEERERRRRREEEAEAAAQALKRARLLEIDLNRAPPGNPDGDDGGNCA